MANYNKSFNFRNGVQVDSDNFIVNASGAVGIGTSIPAAQFDLYGGSKLRGDVSITGLVTSTQAYVSGVSTFNDVRIGTGITIEASSGIITATKFYGDGSTLDNVTSISVVGWEINPGLAGTTSSVGIGTTNPTQKLDVEIQTDKGATGTVLDSHPIAQFNNHSNGVFRGLEFGSSADEVVSPTYIKVLTTSNRFAILDKDNDENLTILNDGKVGIGTSVPIQSLDVIGKTRTEELLVTKTSTFNQHVGLSTGLTVTGVSTFNDTVNVSKDLSVVGLSTFKGNVNLGDTLSDRLYVGASIISDLIPDQTGSDKWDLGWADGGESFHWRNLYLSGNARIGAGVTVVGVSTFNDSIEGDTIYLDGGYIEAVNTAGISTVSIGQSVGVGRSTGLLRFGSADRTFEVLNNDTGDLVFGIHSGDVAGINTGDFKWIHKTSNNLMTLTGIGGSLGINQEDPIHPLHVGGSSTITGAAWFGNNVNVKNNITCEGTITGSFTLQNPITSNVNSTGISTVGGIHIFGGSSNVLGVGTDVVEGSVKLNVIGGTLFRPGDNIGVGINTTAVDANYPLVVRGDMRVNNITGFASETGDDTGVSLQYNKVTKIATTNTGAVITGICTATDFEGAGATAADFPKGATSAGVITATNGFTSGTGTAVKISVSGSVLTFTVGSASTSLTLHS